MLDDKIISKIVRVVLASFPNLYGVYLFGSQVSDQTHNASDIDLAILNNDTLDPSITLNLKNQISMFTKKDVDLIDLRRCDTVTLAQIISTANRILTKNEFECNFFEVTVYSAYALLNEERKEILEDIEARGKIYE